MIDPKPRIERLSECGLDCVDEVHCVGAQHARTALELLAPRVSASALGFTIFP